MKIELAKTEVIHFIGIGGIGMSGLSLIMKGKGFKVQGSDVSSNKNIDRLKKEKIKVFIGQKKQNIKDVTIVVTSSAIKKSNPELLEAKRKKLPVIKRGKMLANLVSLMKNIVVVGSHGKTTTTSLVSSIFENTKLDPTIINGGIINSIKSTAKLGKSDWSILEADESDGSFTHISPTYSIITNIDREHMDFYKSMKDLKNHFLHFIKKVPSFGKSFICTDDKINNELIKDISNFLKDRFKYYLKEKNFRHDIIDASAKILDLNKISTNFEKAKSLNKVIDKPIGVDIVSSYKRAFNIINSETKKTVDQLTNTTDPGIFNNEYEKALFKKTNELKQIFSVVTNKQDFNQTLNSLASAKKEVFEFFDNVKVNDDSEIIKKNRLELLSFFCKTFENFIDFQLIKDANE